MFKQVFIMLCLIMSPLSFGQSIDPTKPFTRAALDKESVEKNLKLYSIIIGDSEPKAIINQKVMKVGDSLDEFKIIKINKSKVVLKSSTETIELSLFANALVKK